MSNRRPKLSLQHQLDHIHGFAPFACPCGIGDRLVLVDVVADPVLEGWMRVATASGLLPAQRSLDKQETPEVPASKVSTDTRTSLVGPGGCCPDCAP